jgi:3-oxoadipate enol-lactonase
MKKADVNGFECRYEVSGNVNAQETIVFLNGIASSLEAWAALGDFFKDDYKLLAYDYRGQWFSETTPPPYTFDMMAQDLYEPMRTNGISEAHLVAHSLGGEVGMTSAVKYPDLCKSLTLITTASEIQPVLYYQVLRWKMAAMEAIAFFDQAGEESPEITKTIGTGFSNISCQKYTAAIL